MIINKKKANYNHGFSTIYLILILIIVTLVAFVGYRVYYAQKISDTNTGQPSNVVNDTDKTEKSASSTNNNSQNSNSSNSVANKINILGDEECINKTNEALSLLESKTPYYYEKANKYIGTIECADKGSGMFAFEIPPRFLVGDATRNAGTVWYASVIVHEYEHSRLYNDYYNSNPGQIVPDDIWMGKAAEKVCLDTQYDALLKLGGTQSQLDIVKNALSTEYYNIPYDQRWW